MQRACGLRIGELLDLELDCIHEIPGQGSWLKVPLGKLNSERMIPVDDKVLTLVDRITTTRSAGRPMIHPRTGAPQTSCSPTMENNSPTTPYAKNLTRQPTQQASGTSHRTNCDTPTPPR